MLVPTSISQDITLQAKQTISLYLESKLPTHQLNTLPINSHYLYHSDNMISRVWWQGKTLSEPTNGLSLGERLEGQQ
jgi:hypothetical protein